MPKKPDFPKTRWCWWFGHFHHPDDPAPPEHARCYYCDEPVSYADMVGDTRHARLLAGLRTLRYWAFRKWFPKPCPDCGRRWECNPKCDHLPF